MDCGLMDRCGEENGEVLDRCSVEQLSEFRVQSSGTAALNYACKMYYFYFLFPFWTIYFLKVNRKRTNAVILQCIDILRSRTCFGTLKCHHQGVNHDPAEIGAQCRCL
jgi:hypothetical protein